MDVDPRAITIRPYPQNPRETRGMSTNSRAASVPQTDVNLRVVARLRGLLAYSGQVFTRGL